MNLWAILLAAGSGLRLARAGAPDKKQFLPCRGVPLFWHSARTLARAPRMRGLILVLPGGDEAEYERRIKAARELFAAEDLGLPWIATQGGERRQDSVLSGLDALPKECDAVLVHDSARPFASAQLVESLVQALQSGKKAVIPALAVTDTIKRVKDSLIIETLDRSELVAVQTPQAFDRPLLAQAHAKARELHWEATDDASLVELMGHVVATVPGQEDNVKITNPEDLALLADQPLAQTMVPRTAMGYDVHRYGPGRPLKLGGEPIPGPWEVVAHSDGDVLLHAVTDALLGLIGGGDIGDRFPDTDAEWENRESAYFVDQALADVIRAGLTLVHADLTIVAQAPKIAPHKLRIRDNVARLLSLQPEHVAVKATTEEGLGFTGEKKGIKAVALLTALGPR